MRRTLLSLPAFAITLGVFSSTFALKTTKIVAYAGLLSFFSSALLAGDIGVEGSVTATTFVGDGTGITGVVKTEVDPVVNALIADKWCKADATGGVVNCDQDAPVTVEGVEVGDMQYWDGVAWVLIPAPPVDGRYGLISAAGVPHWAPVIYAIGDTGPAGGIVFHTADGGMHGLEAAPADQSDSAVWGCAGTITGADGIAVGTGAQNTADILAGCATLGIAARVANDYTLNGFTDWFLPSKDELNLLYQQQVDEGVTEGFYWSSSESTSNSAWYHFFGNGLQTTTNKGNGNRVRAVRAF